MRARAAARAPLPLTDNERTGLRQALARVGRPAAVDAGGVITDTALCLALDIVYRAHGAAWRRWLDGQGPEPPPLPARTDNLVDWRAPPGETAESVIDALASLAE